MTISVFCEHRMVGNDFDPASLIWCHDCIGAVACVRRSEACTITVLSVLKTTPRKLLASDGYPKYVENRLLVFGTVTLVGRGEQQFKRPRTRTCTTGGFGQLLASTLLSPRARTTSARICMMPGWLSLSK
jgi:hypothetical protein